MVHPQAGRSAWEAAKKLAANPTVRKGAKWIGAVAGPLILERIQTTGREKFKRMNPAVAVTGLPGSGKTVLVAQLCSRNRDYQPQDFGSATVEKKSLRNGLKGVRFRIIPGGLVSARDRGMDELFYRNPVSGVVHVVANGYHTPRSSPIGQEEAPTRLEEYREIQKNNETEDFKSTCDKISTLIRKSTNPIWLIIAIGKIDLYTNGLDEALAYYKSAKDSPFVHQLTKFIREVGEKNVTIDFVPYFSLSEDFTLGTTTVPSTGTAAERDKSLDLLTQRIRNMVGQLP